MSQKVEDNGGSFGDLVYSPDLQTYDLAGSRGLLSTVSSFIIGPIRLVSRVSTNIAILPSSLTKAFGNSLLIVGGCFSLLGLVDLLLFKKWPLLVSQVPVIIYGLQQRRSGESSLKKEKAKREVVVDTEALNDYCNTLETEIHKALGNEEEGSNEHD